MFADRHHQAAEDLADELGGVALASNRLVAQQSDLLVLAVKPNVQSEVIREIRETVLFAKELCVISIAAGRTTDQIISDFGAAIPLVRVMPNVNAQIGQSMSALCPVGTTDEQLAAARKLLDSVGQTIVLDEKYFPVFTAIASSSPAWIFRMIDAMAEAGVNHGLTKADSTRIVAQAFAGSAQLLLRGLENGQVPANLIDRVSSPGGTTIAGLLAAQEAGLSSAIVAAGGAGRHPPWRGGLLVLSGIERLIFNKKFATFTIKIDKERHTDTPQRSSPTNALPSRTYLLPMAER